MRSDVSWRLFAVSAVVLSVVFMGCCCCIPPEPPPDVTPTPELTPTPFRTPIQGNGTLAEWTVMVYLDGDNDLEEFAMGDMNELEKVGSTDKVNFVVQLDRSSGNYDGDGDWAGTKRYLVQRDSDLDEIGSAVVEDLGEVNMGETGTLVDFAEWSIRNYPAKRYALIIWDHGAGWPGIAIDEASGDDLLQPAELSDGLAQIATMRGSKIELIGFDACLMAMFEVCAQVAPHGKVMVASEETIPGNGWDYEAFGTELTENPTMDERGLAQAITSTYLTFYQTVEKDQTVTLSAVDLEKVDDLKGSMDAFSGRLASLSETSATWSGIAYGLSYVESYGRKDWGYVDLKDFADLVAFFSDDAAATAAAQDLSRTIDEVVIYNVHGDQHPHSAGISIDSSTDASGTNDGYMSLLFAQDTEWVRFMRAYYGEKETGASSSSIEVSELELDRTSISPGETVSISTTVTGSNIRSAEMMVFAEREYNDGSNYYVLVDYIEYDPPVYEMEDGSTVQNWMDGDNPIEVEWDGTGLVVEDDEGYIHIAITPIGRDSDMYSIEGIYKRGDGSEVDSSIVFDLRTRDLVYIWNYDEASEIFPEEGDRFTAQTPAFDLEEGSDVFTVDYEDLVWGPSGWTVSTEDFDPGTYVLALSAEDLYENDDLEVAFIEVE